MFTRRSFLRHAAVFALMPLVLKAKPATASTQRRWVWRNLGGDKRHAYGIWSWEQYLRLFDTIGGQNDMRRVKMPAPIADAIIRGARQLRLNGQQGGSLTLDGIALTFSEAYVPKGSVYNFITYNDAGYTVENVEVGFTNGDVYRVTAQLRDGTTWTYDTFKVCGNGAQAVQVLTARPPAPPQPPVPLQLPPAPPRISFTPATTVVHVVGPTQRQSYAVKGIFPDLANIAARWLGQPVTNIAMATGPVYGSSATGGSATGGSASATTAPINVQQQSNNTNQTQVITPINIVTGDNSAGTATGAGAQDAPTIQQQDQD